MMGKSQMDARIFSHAKNSFLCLKSSASPQWKILHVHYIILPPFVYKAQTDGSLIGNDVEIWNSVAKYLDVQIKYIQGWSFNALPTKVTGALYDFLHLARNTNL